jgi:uncharacterized protein (TIGR02594 family)
MQSIIDSPYNLGNFAVRLHNEGVRTVIRYYNNVNSRTFPDKCLTKVEATKLAAAGLSLGVVYQQRGGASADPAGNIDDFSPELAERDARRALERAAEVGQPSGSAIYFGVDHDFYLQRDLAVIKAYFAKVKARLSGRYRVGVYGSGSVCTLLRNAGSAELFWLPRSSGWSGSRDFLQSGLWTLFQNQQDIRSDWGGFDYDTNQFNPAYADFGQFSPIARNNTPENLTTPARNVALYEVIAADGLNLRGGPGTNYPIKQSFLAHTHVNGLGLEGEWMLVDVSGDGLADGYMKAGFLKALSGGLPAPAPEPLTPLEIARTELALGVAEVVGSQHNPRIVMYHRLTRGGAAPDETAWCSSFVNYCVTQAGMTGTNDKWARTWHDRHWGQDRTDAPLPGDIVVWRRRWGSAEGGHVGFFIEDLGDRIRVLGGNQGNRVSYAVFPKAGTIGSTRYDILSIRRG